VLTMTLTGIGADSRAGRRGHLTLARRLLAVVTILAGAMLGAWLVLNVGAVVPLAVAAVLVAISAILAVLAVRHPGEWRSPATSARPGPPGSPGPPEPPGLAPGATDHPQM
jgi:uncharacterized membrane protein YfcA